MSLLDEIQALPNAAALIATRDESVIAALLSVGRTKTISKQIGIGTVLSTLGAAGGPFLDGMVAIGAADRNVHWAMKLLEAGVLDIGMAATRAQMTALADAMPEIAGAIAALLALAVEPDPYTAHQVAVALEGVL